MAVCSAHYEDVYQSEPEAPTFSLGERVIWNGSCGSRLGTLRWIGRIPQLYQDWTVGVEFDEPVPNGGDGHFNRRRYFSSIADHALFLPVSDIVPADVNNFIEHSNHAQPSNPPAHMDHMSCHSCHLRDSTYGYYRHNCTCSACSRCECLWGLHCSDRSPVYGHISSRQALDQREHLYESYSRCHGNEQDCAQCHPVHHHHQYSPIRKGSRRNYEDNVDPIPQISSRDARNCIRDSNGYTDQVTTVNIPYKESVFAPRSTIRLISGFKDWITYWVLGTTRQKRKQSIVLKGRKTVASLIVSNGSQSLSKTGQRLSSFNEYSSIDSCTMHKRLKERQSNAELNHKVTNVNTTENTKKYIKHRHRHKKGPAPPPPKNQSSVRLTPVKGEKQLSDTASNYRKSYSSTHGNSSLPSSSKKGQVMVTKMNGAMEPRKSPKKRRAPLPPVAPQATQQSSEFHANFLRQAQQAGFLLNDKGKHMFHITNRQSSLEIQSSNRKHLTRSEDEEEDTDEWEIVSLPKDFPHSNGYIANGQLFDDMEYADLDRIESEINNLKSYTGGNDLKSTNAIDKYKSGHKTFGGEVVDSQYLKNDKRLKISIAKTEMNVVTVEEIQENSDQPSSLSELSEEDDRNGEDQDGVDILKSSSSEESLPPMETKPIFNELRMTPPTKASVKDFVQAFNMLADRGRHSDSNMQRNPPRAVTKTQKTTSNTASDIQSFPTKWQYRQSVPSRNNYLLPIQEESHNDSSETEGNTLSMHSSKPLDVESSLANSSKEKENPGKYSKEIATISPRSVATNTKVARGKPIASNAALSSLLSPDSAAAVASSCKGAKMKRSSGNISKLKDDQPIVVSLYIEDKSSHRGPMPFIVTPSMTLRKLKKKVEKEYNFDKDLQCWILGETFAIHDEAPLSTYGVIDSGCPILLYVMSVESKTKSLPFRSNSRTRKIPIYDDVAHSSSDSEGEDVGSSLDREVGRNLKISRASAGEKMREPSLKYAGRQQIKKTSSGRRKAKNKIENSTVVDNDLKRKDYHALVQLDGLDLVSNVEAFECPICFLEVDPGSGALLQECLHAFCKECLAGAIEYSETAVIKCPFRNEQYSCESHLQEREVKSLVSPEVFERHLQRSMALAESQAQDSFHCKAPDCPGWCLFEDNVNIFFCPVCKQTNCLTCGAIHEGRNCRQYQDDVASRCDSSEEAKKTKDYLEKMVTDGDAMKCPKCAVILMKKWGCDWLKCSMCHTEVCWVTKGPRWGPEGRGDTSGGCKCMLNGVRCHPKCSYCH